MRKLILGLVALGFAGLVGCGGSGGINRTSMKIYVQQKLYDKAIYQGMQALTTNPEDGDTNYFLGVAYYSKDGELKPEAETYADSSEIFLSKAYEHFQKAKKVAAGQWGQSADQNIVSMFGRHYNRGVIASKKNDNAGAAVEYRLATIADPENYTGWYAHAAALLPLALDAKKADDEAQFTELANRAIADLDKVLELKPAEREKIVNVYQTKGEIQWRLDQKEAAQNSFKEAVQLDPENYEMLCTIGERFYQEGEKENAAEYLNACLSVQERLGQIDPDDAETMATVATIYLGQEKFLEALDMLGKALELQPDNADLLYNRLVTHYKYGDKLEKDGKGDEAKVQYNEGINVGTSLIAKSQKPEYFQVRGYCKRAIGDTAGAAIDLKKFNELRQRGAN